MRKKLLMGVVGLLSCSAIVLAAVGTGDAMGAPGVEGIGQEGSKTEVRVRANVVAGVAVNEAEPIDFGNLVRGSTVYTPNELINSRTPGRVVFRADQNMIANGKIYAKLEKDTTTLLWQNNNGSSGDGSITDIKNVTVRGMTTNEEVIDMDGNGQAQRVLTGHFYAYDNGTNTTDTSNGNLGANQKLGSYIGTVIVQATLR